MTEIAAHRIFDVGINDPLPPGQLLVLGLQNVFGMTGMFVFPGLLGRSFNLPPEQIAYLYGMTFAVCGFITDPAVGAGCCACRSFRGRTREALPRCLRWAICRAADWARLTDRFSWRR